MSYINRANLDGDVCYYYKDNLHALHKPARVQADGTEEWFRNGLRHRTNEVKLRWVDGIQVWEELDQPAYTRPDGYKSWWSNGLLHRENDKPAIIDSNGTQFWYSNGLQHRENDMPAVVHLDGTVVYYSFGEMHRENDMPAYIMSDGTRFWYANGLLHRLIGPAVIYPDGKAEYWVNNIEYAIDQFLDFHFRSTNID